MKIVLILLLIASCHNLNILSSKDPSSFLQNKVELQYASENKFQDKIEAPKALSYNLVKFAVVKQDEIIEHTHNLKLERDSIHIILENSREDVIKYSE
jgi:hypothetical protein